MSGKRVAQKTEAQIKAENEAIYAEDRRFSQWEADGRGE
jgi:hypothetical protein